MFSIDHFESNGHVYIVASGKGDNADFFRLADFDARRLTSKSQLPIFSFVAKFLYFF